MRCEDPKHFQSEPTNEHKSKSGFGLLYIKSESQKKESHYLLAKGIGANAEGCGWFGDYKTGNNIKDEYLEGFDLLYGDRYRTINL